MASKLVGSQASEFGGLPQRNGVQPLPHIPTPSEQLSLIYRTGDPSGLSPVDTAGDIWFGLRAFEVQYAAREAEGALVVGERAAELEIEAQGVIAALAAQSAVES